MLRSSAGNLFHSLGAAALNEQSPSVILDLALAGTRSRELPERRLYPVGVDLVTSSDKYNGARSYIHLNVIIKILN